MIMHSVLREQLKEHKHLRRNVLHRIGRLKKFGFKFRHWKTSDESKFPFVCVYDIDHKPKLKVIVSESKKVTLNEFLSTYEKIHYINSL